MDRRKPTYVEEATYGDEAIDRDYRRMEQLRWLFRGIVFAALLALILLLGGCASPAPSTQYEQCWAHWYKGCTHYAQEELREEIQAGFYDLGDVTDHCRTFAKRQCPAILKELPPRG